MLKVSCAMHCVEWPTHPSRAGGIFLFLSEPCVLHTRMPLSPGQTGPIGNLHTFLTMTLWDPPYYHSRFSEERMDDQEAEELIRDGIAAVIWGSDIWQKVLLIISARHELLLFSSLSHVKSNTLRPHGLQHIRPPWTWILKLKWNIFMA